MDKYIIFSHESDIDGLGCVVLAKLAFTNIEFELFPNVEQLEITFRNYLQKNKLNNYKNIFITDLALYDPSLSIVANSSLKNKTLIFDHHQRAINDNMDRYPFTKIIEKDSNKKKCATELFYEYLVNNNFLKSTNTIKEFVELTRLEDTWEWKDYGKFGQDAHDLAILFNSIGLKKYLNYMIDKLSNETKSFIFNDYEKEIIKKKKNEYNKKMKEIISTIEYFLDENNNKFGIVYANYEYRNEIPEYIINLNNTENIKYIIIVAMDKGEFGQKSYRSIENNFNVNEIAMKHGGGGHITAAYVNITKDQKNKATKLENRESLKYLADCKYKS